MINNDESACNVVRYRRTHLVGKGTHHVEGKREGATLQEEEEKTTTRYCSKCTHVFLPLPLSCSMHHANHAQCTIQKMYELCVSGIIGHFY